MIYAGRSIATFLTRSKVALVVIGGIATMTVDVVVAPVSVRGSQWFLGDLFRYESHGPWFGVPLGNFGGWVLVAAAVIGLDLLAAGGEPVRPAVRGVLLAAGVIAFDLVLAFAIGATLAGFAGMGVAGIIGLALLGARWTQRQPEPVT